MEIVTGWGHNKGHCGIGDVCQRGERIKEHLRCVVLSHFSHAQLFMTLWTIALQVPLTMGFSRQEYWSGLPCPPPGDLPDSEIEPSSRICPALGGRCFTTSAAWETQRAPTLPRLKFGW